MHTSTASILRGVRCTNSYSKITWMARVMAPARALSRDCIMFWNCGNKLFISSISISTPPTKNSGSSFFFGEFIPQPFQLCISGGVLFKPLFPVRVSNWPKSHWINNEHLTRWEPITYRKLVRNEDCTLDFLCQNSVHRPNDPHFYTASAWFGCTLKFKEHCSWWYSKRLENEVL